MAFKMKGPSMHKGTAAHRSALKEIGNTLDIMNRGKKASPAKADETVDNEKQKRREERRKEREEKRRLRKEHKEQLKDAKKIRKESDKKLNEERKQKKKEQKAKDLKEKRDQKIADTITDVDKPGTVVSRTAKKIGEKVKEGAKNIGTKVKDKVKETKKNITQRLTDRKKARENEMAKADTPEKRIALRKERRSKIADNLEYIFLDGKRPEEAAHRRANDYYKEDEKLNKKEPEQTKDTDIDNTNKNETTYDTLQSEPGDPYQYRYDAATDTYQYKGPKDDDFKSHEKGSKGDNAIRNRYANK